MTVTVMFSEKTIRAESLRPGDQVISRGKLLAVQRVMLLDDRRVAVAYARGWIKRYNRDESVRLGAMAER